MNHQTGESDQEDLLYEELLCAYQALPEGESHMARTSNQDQWLALNNTMDALVALGHGDYVKFKIATEHPIYNGTRHTEVNIVALKMKMMSALGRMGREFGCGSPAHDLSQFKNTGTAFNVSQTANPVNTAHAQQSQEMTVKLDLRFGHVEKELTDGLSDAQKAELLPLFNEWKQDPTVWSKAEKVAQAALGFGRDSFMIVLPLLAQAFMKSRGMI